ncbi:MAG: hypothetical protein V4462_02880 [Pseudomonadota bacterium]
MAKRKNTAIIHQNARDAKKARRRRPPPDLHWETKRRRGAADSAVF